jgi:hypothetical protein
MSVWVVLKVASLAEVEVLEAVCGVSVVVAKESRVGRVDGAVSRVTEEGTVVSPMVRMICEDLVGRASMSSLVMGGNSAARTPGIEM